VRILLAEEHALARRGFRQLLEVERDWIVCAEADNGNEAVILCEMLLPDVAVLDVVMPWMGGLAAAERIRGIAPAIAVILVSTRVDEALVKAAIDVGARACIPKYEAHKHLVSAVRTLIESDATYFPSRES
jgi:DNA-binding NarL/FixJ family response regulator